LHCHFQVTRRVSNTARALCDRGDQVTP
jgi:hypothetical protein